MDRFELWSQPRTDMVLGLGCAAVTIVFASGVRGVDINGTWALLLPLAISAVAAWHFLRRALKPARLLAVDANGVQAGTGPLIPLAAIERVTLTRGRTTLVTVTWRPRPDAPTQEHATVLASQHPGRATAAAAAIEQFRAEAEAK